ncbi:MAG: RHS repeat-associated core domain-containing protein [Phycisphaeraceae bacterium]
MPKPLKSEVGFTASRDAWQPPTKLTDDANSNATVAEYQWDGIGRRIVLAHYDAGVLDETRHFYYNDHSILEERLDGTADIDMDLQYLWGLQYVDELIARHDGTDWLFALHNANYRVTAIVNELGSVVERYRYSPYGSRTVLNTNWTTHADPDEGSYNIRIGHQGLRHDETGLVYNRARMLHVTLGRFTTRDPLGYVDGMSLYQYARTNPFKYIDLWGTEAREPGDTKIRNVRAEVVRITVTLVMGGDDISFPVVGEEEGEGEQWQEDLIDDLKDYIPDLRNSVDDVHNRLSKYFKKLSPHNLAFYQVKVSLTYEIAYDKGEWRCPGFLPRWFGAQPGWVWERVSMGERSIGLGSSDRDLIPLILNNAEDLEAAIGHGTQAGSRVYMGIPRAIEQMERARDEAEQRLLGNTDGN